MPASSDSSETSCNLAHDLRDWRCEELQPDVRLIVNESEPELTPDVERHVQAIWDKARALRPKLFNGRIFCMDRIAPDRIEGHWTEYRRALAQMAEPTIFGDTPLHQLAVCGLLRCADGVVLGRRHPSSLYLGGFWQSPPAGTVEMRKEAQSFSLADQILAEAEEEVGLTHHDVSVSAPRLAVTHSRTAIVDIGVPLTTPLSFTAVQDRWMSHANREYDRLTVISDDQIEDWRLREDVLPTTRALLHTK
ncbi:MAG: phosphohydrolase [Acetobacter aceti]|uniref:Phosphohydrolase n=1 Tax=Acetobacter aceti TaxID=435 RepID=A0A1U9KGC5_ACEAC|nr:phosphohydrolase [Acetobacter aceti]AQS84840.1 phosphohydrolase [Acetobacter aceti]